MKNREKQIQNRINELIRQFFSDEEEPFVPGETQIPLNVPGYCSEEVIEVLDSLLSGWVTMGEKVTEFEQQWANYVGSEHAIMVNSGSSANLIAYAALTNPDFSNRIKPGEEVIVPAVNWSTAIFPIVQMGARPVLVDVEPESFALDPEQIREAVTKKTRAIMPVHLLGFPCRMGPIQQIAKAHDLFVIEDCCEAHGARDDGSFVGTFGDIGTFSFFFSHHMTTIEGGMIVTDNDRIADLARILRAHGWGRDTKQRQEISGEHPDIDERYLFVNLGYNLRPTEIQGAFGIHQLDRLESFIETRRENAEYWTSVLASYDDHITVPETKASTQERAVWFGYPVVVRPDSSVERDDLTAFLEQQGIETRPIMGGNMARQPAMDMIDYRQSGTLSRADHLMNNGFLFGNHHGIGEEERKYIAECFEAYFSG